MSHTPFILCKEKETTDWRFEGFCQGNGAKNHAVQHNSPWFCKSSCFQVVSFCYGSTFIPCFKAEKPFSSTILQTGSKNVFCGLDWGIERGKTKTLTLSLIYIKIRNYCWCGSSSHTGFQVKTQFSVFLEESKYNNPEAKKKKNVLKHFKQLIQMTAIPTGYASLSKESVGWFMWLFRKSFKGGRREIARTFILAHPCSVFMFVARCFFFFFFQDEFLRAISVIIL